jgi:hypothetical protein
LVQRLAGPANSGNPDPAPCSPVWLTNNLMEKVSAYDATIFERADMWWMFVNIKGHSNASSWDELHIFMPLHRSATTGARMR